MFALNMTVMALDLCAEGPAYEDIAIQCHEQFLAIADAIDGNLETGTPSLWDPETGFFKDLLVGPDGTAQRIDVYSWVGLIPLFATEVIHRRLLAAAPRFAARLPEHKHGLFRGRYICACPDWENDRGEHLLALVDSGKLPMILERLLDSELVMRRYREDIPEYWRSQKVTS